MLAVSFQLKTTTLPKAANSTLLLRVQVTTSSYPFWLRAVNSLATGYYTILCHTILHPHLYKQYFYKINPHQIILFQACRLFLLRPECK